MSAPANSVAPAFQFAALENGSGLAMLEIEEITRRCPHQEAIQYCPLYVAAHAPKCAGLTCLGSRSADFGQCDVDRGKMDFARAVEVARAVDPMLVAQCEFGHMKHQHSQQRNTNMRLNGVH